MTVGRFVVTYLLPLTLLLAAAVDYRRGFKPRAGVLVLIAFSVGTSTLSRLYPSRALDVLSTALTVVMVIVAWRYLQARLRGTAA